MPQTFGSYEKLSKKWTEKHRKLQKKLVEKHKESLDFIAKNSKQLAVGSLGSLILLTTPAKPEGILQASPSSSQIKEIDKNAFVISDLSNALPSDVVPLTPDQETKISSILSRDYGVSVKAEIDGKRLNRTYGLIGAEQHLARFPGDSMVTHFDNQSDASQFYSSGMAPGLGAWGYFAQSQSQMTQEDNLREKYYIAVQTFLSEDFSSRFGEYRDFFKYRKMLVVNPQNGKAVVADIGDSGPAVWTGKHLGGSPEVMSYLERYDGAQRGPVLYYFIDDPDNKIPLGPINNIE